MEKVNFLISHHKQQIMVLLDILMQKEKKKMCLDVYLARSGPENLAFLFEHISLKDVSTILLKDIYKKRKNDFSFELYNIFLYLYTKNKIKHIFIFMVKSW